MSVEQNVSDILANLEGRRPGSWAHQASIVAEGLRGSGIIDQIDQASDRLQTNLAGLAAVMGISAQTVAAEIAVSNRFLGMVRDSLRDPRATAANERFRTGITALQKGWRPEAIEELQESIALFRFHAPAHSALGHALAAEGRLGEAADSYLLAERYSMPDNPAFAAGCILLAASALLETGEAARAEELLQSASDTYREFPEVALASARVSHDPERLRAALVIAPDLVVAAMAAGIPDVEKMADDLAVSADGPVVLAARFIAAVESLRAAFPGTVIQPSLPHIGKTSSVDDLMTASQVLREMPRVIASLRAQPPAAGSRTLVPAARTALPYMSELESLLTELRAIEIQQSGLNHDISRTSSLLEVPLGNFRYEPTHVDFLPGKQHRTSSLMDKLAELEANIRNGVVPPGLPDFAAAGSAMVRQRRDLAQLGVDDAAATRERDEEEYRIRVRQKGDEARRLLKELQDRRTEVDTRMATLTIQVEAEQEARLKAEQTAHDLAMSAVAQEKAVKDKWSEAVATVESVAALKPVRRSPWDGATKTPA